MSVHPALTTGHTAVITGAADGIGLATAKKCAELGMNVCAADIDEEKLIKAVQEELEPLLASGDSSVLAYPLDVADRDAVEAFHGVVSERFKAVHLLMNNAGTVCGGEAWNNYAGWRKVFEVNLWGAINCVSVFAESMMNRGEHALIVNTGSKQGITCPPGDSAYNTTKAALKAFTESLQHTLRNTENCRVSAHLLVPGFTYTGLMRPWFENKPDAAWWPDQVVDYMLAALAEQRFYILCPDNDVDEELDKLRIQWAAGDLIEGRPALSRWHPDYEEAYKTFTGG